MSRPPRSVLAVTVCVALLVAGCGAADHGALVPEVVARVTGVMVRDSLDSPVVGASVLALRLDAVEPVLAALTDGEGVARFTLNPGRWVVSTHVSPGGGPTRVAGSIGRVPPAGPGVPDSVLFRLQLAIESVALGGISHGGPEPLSGTLVSVVELPPVASTNATGRYVLGALPRGVWTGIAARAGFQAAVFDIAVPAPGDTVSVPSILLQPAAPPAQR